MKERVLKAFWHRTRKAFVPWTPSELARRTGLQIPAVIETLHSFYKSGLAQARTTTKGAGDESTWHLTEAGKAIALSIITAEAFARGNNA